MAAPDRPYRELLAEVGQLRTRLNEAEEILAAIGAGEVDAFVVSGPDGDQIFTLKGAEYPYRVMLETMNEGAAALIADGTVFYCNNILAAMLQVPPESLTGTQFASYIAPEYRPGFTARLEEGADAYSTDEITLITGRGNLLPALISSSALYLSGSRGISVVVIDITKRKKMEEELKNSRDLLEMRVQERTAELWRVNQKLEAEIAERKRAEAALRDSEMLYRAIGESIDYGVWVCTPDGRNIYTSKSFLNLVGITQEKFSDFNWAQFLDPDDAERTVSAWKECVAVEGIWDIELRFRGVDGQWHPILARGVPVRNENGEVIYWAGINLDISRLKQVEDALRKSEQKYRQLNETLEQRIKDAVEELHEKTKMLIIQGRQAVMGEMIGNIAHQWRQPLNMLGLIAQELPVIYKRGEFSAEYIDANVKKMMQSIQQMSNTIDDFRDFFQTDKIMVNFNVYEMIGKTMSLLEAGLKARGIRIEIEVTDDISINGYPNEFVQVLLNIVNNARDALLEQNADDPAITIRSWIEGGKVVVTVSDNAGGIPEGIMYKVFEPYFTTKGPDKGTGIGMYMSKIIIEEHMNGRLSVRNVGAGAEFRIEL